MQPTVPLYVSPGLWRLPVVPNLETAVLYTLAYSDVFDYPLTSEQIVRYLIGLSASHGEVRRALGSVAGIETDGHYHYLRGRGDITALRRSRDAVSQHIWPRAVAYGLRIARMPFVRMVALTGALAMGNASSENDDYDYLIVTEPGRLWMTRAMVIALVVRPAALVGFEICPNYIVTSDHLIVSQRDLYTAHELAQMVPLAGHDLYQMFRRSNAWTDAFLPNAQGSPSQQVPADGRRRGLTRTVVEPLLRSHVCTRFEQWEMHRKIVRLSAGEPDAELSFDEHCCKGHVGSHSRQVHAESVQRLAALPIQSTSTVGSR